MAISTIPSITGPNFGGVIYGLNLNINYSNSPSTLKLNIINKEGKYQIPSDWKQYSQSTVNVTFGNFKFIGFPWAYSLKETASEKVLELELIDSSVILDRYHVLLWKKNIFDDGGESFTEGREIDISDEIVLAPFWNPINGLIDFKETPLTKQRIERTMFRAGRGNIGGGTKGNIIYVGREAYKPSRCDIPQNYYFLKDLAVQANKLPGVNISSIVDKGNADFQGTYEGTLREVLSAWCGDLGFDFYWDFNQNKLEFFDTKLGINPNMRTFADLKSDNLIEKTTSESMKGTFKQYALAYTQKPKENLKTKTESFQFSIVTTINSIPPSWFLFKNEVKPKPQSTSGAGAGQLISPWGERNAIFLETSVYLNYLNKNLRNILLMNGGRAYQGIEQGVTELSSPEQIAEAQNQGKLEAPEWSAMGFSFIRDLGSQKQSIIDELKIINEEQIKNLELVDAENLPGYNFALVSFDEAQLTRWQELESEYFNFIGAYYRHGVNGGSFFYCTKNSINEVNISVDPEGTFYEGQNDDFQGLKLFSRGANNSSKTPEVIAKALELNNEKNSSIISSLTNTHVELTDGLRQLLNIPSPEEDEDSPINPIILIYPSNELFKRKLTDFKVKLYRGINPLESTWVDNAGSSQSIKNNCLPFDEEIRENSCISAEEEARELALLEIMPPPDETELFSGLSSGSARAIKINIFENEESFYASSDAPYYVVTRYSINIQKILSLQDVEYIYFKIDGSDNPTANDVEKIDVLFDNATDPLLDTYGFKRDVNKIPTAKSVSNDRPQQVIGLTFAGSPPQNVPLSIKNGLSSIDISYSSDGFKTRLQYSSRPPSKPKNEVILRKMQSQLNRASFNST